MFLIALLNTAQNGGGGAGFQVITRKLPQSDGLWGQRSRYSDELRASGRRKNEKGRREINFMA